MNTLVVLFALASVACGSYVPLAQPPHHPALVLDPHGRPLDTAEVINARALHLQAKALDGHHGHYGHAAVVAPLAHSVALAPSVWSAPAAVSHQSRVDVRHSPAIVSHAIAAPVLAHASPLWGHSAVGYAAHGHYLHKRSLGHYAYAAPVVAVAPSAVSHQSRVDVHHSPAIVAHTAVTPIAHAAPLYSTYSSLATPIFGAHAYSHGLGFSHILKKRSLARIVAPVVHSVPAAVSHQSRVDVISEPAVVSSHIVPAVYSAPAAYTTPIVSHVTPIARSAAWPSVYHLGAAHHW